MDVFGNVKESEVVVIKKDGSTEAWNPDKIYKQIKYACEGTKINPSDILMDLQIKLTKKIKSRDIQQTVIKTAADKIDEDNPDYEVVAAMLSLQQLRKDVYGKFNPSNFVESVKERVAKKYYDSYILDAYTEEELNELGGYIDYDRDKNFRYIGLLQEIKKLLIRQKNGIPIETPQEAFMLISAYMFSNEKKYRLKKVVQFYHSLSNFEIILSTPIGVGVRTLLRMYSSCAGVMVEDNANAIAQAFHDIYLLTINRAGIGANWGHIRGIGASIDNGRETHTGLTPLLKVAEKISLSAVQPGSGRGGAVTNYYPFFHIEIETILELKNNKGTEDNRVRQSDHAIVFNNLFYKRYANNEDITLFYMHEVPKLYEHIGMDDFEELYTYYENKRGITKIKISAKKLYDKFWVERASTARLYKVNANEFQKHSAFRIPVYNSNLCLEINLPSFGFDKYAINIKEGYKDAMKSLIYDIEEEGLWFSLYEHLKYGEKLPEHEFFDMYKSMLAKPKDIRNNKFIEYTINFYEIFACILGGYNLSKAKNYKDIEKGARQLVRFLDNLIDYQEYPIAAMKRAATGRRALGISVSGLFHYLAKKDFDYNTLEARNEVHKIMEALYYGAITESIKLAKERGACHFYNDTKYSDGLLTIDTYNKNVDELVTVDYQYNWDEVRENLEKYGLRNSTLLTLVPASNSARGVHTIAGIDLPQDLTMKIEDKRINGNMCLPDVQKYRDYYIRNNAWTADMGEYYKTIAVMQKFIDQSISLNSYYDYTRFENELLPYSKILEDDYIATKFGIKTQYYFKTRSDDEYAQSKNKTESVCKDGGCEL